MPRFQPLVMLGALEEQGVEYVLIGGLAATLHGSTLRTGDADICPARDARNLDRLAAALTRQRLSSATCAASATHIITHAILSRNDVGARGAGRGGCHCWPG